MLGSCQSRRRFRLLRPRSRNSPVRHTPNVNCDRTELVLTSQEVWWCMPKRQAQMIKSEPPRVYRRVKHSKGGSCDKEKTYPPIRSSFVTAASGFFVRTGPIIPVIQPPAKQLRRSLAVHRIACASGANRRNATTASALDLRPKRRIVSKNWSVRFVRFVRPMRS